MLAPATAAGATAAAMPSGFSVMAGVSRVVSAGAVGVSFLGASVGVAMVAAGGAGTAAGVLFAPSMCLGSLVDASSTSVCLAGSLSPNLMIGIVSRIALPRPFALLWRGLPSKFLGP